MGAEAFFHRGFDVFALDLRHTGRSKKFREITDLPVENFEEYNADIESALDFMGVSQHSSRYQTCVAYGHSTGGLVLANFLLSSPGADLISHIILNSPFLDWKHVNSLSERYLENDVVEQF